MFSEGIFFCDLKEGGKSTKQSFLLKIEFVKKSNIKSCLSPEINLMKIFKRKTNLKLFIFILMVIYRD